MFKRKVLFVFFLLATIEVSVVVSGIALKHDNVSNDSDQVGPKAKLDCLG